MTSSRTFSIALVGGLLGWSLALPVLANEPAYVDSPAGRAVQDPARTDARAAPSDPTAATAYQAEVQQAEQDAEYARQYEEQLRMLETQMAAAQQANAQRMAAERQQSYRRGGFDPTSYADPPIGGRDLAAELGQGGIMMSDVQVRTEPPAPPAQGMSPGRQLGAGLTQDAAGLLDAGIQGDDGTVVLPPLPPGP